MKRAIAGVLLVLSAVSLTCAAAAGEQKFPPPAPKYEVRVERSVMVPMRDGVRLSTDLYFPEGVTGKLPVILMRTPYGKHLWPVMEARMFAGQGYAVAVQDVRGKYESGGWYTVYVAEAADGYNTVTWLAEQPWSNGKVGTYGCSALGENQILQARLRNPHLAAMIPKAAGGAYRGPDYRNGAANNGGAHELAADFGWLRQYQSKVNPRFPDDVPASVVARSAKYFDLAPQIPQVDYRTVWRTLPLLEMMNRTEGPPTDWEALISHEPADPWWRQFGYIEDTDTFDVPALHVNSWYDFGVNETLALAALFSKNGVSARARENQFVVISPATHCRSELATGQTVVGERALGDAQLDFWGLYLRWFDHWLKGVDNGVTSMPKVQIYVMGRNEWRAESKWPLIRTQFTPFYFHSDGRANSRYGSGALSTTRPANESPDHYTYDPNTPVPSVGGPICCTGSPDAPEGAFDQSAVEMRHDVLVYTSAPLEKGIEVTGPLEVVLYVSSSAPDTDFTAKLVDVYPDGTAYNVQEGILRARYREGFEKRVWMKPGEVYEVRINLHATSNYFGPRHRIRVEVSSSNFPRFDRNLNTGGNNYDENEWKVAENIVHHSRAYPSHIVLPVIP